VENEIIWIKELTSHFKRFKKKNYNIINLFL